MKRVGSSTHIIIANICASNRSKGNEGIETDPQVEAYNQ
jgi:hypothetical protein